MRSMSVDLDGTERHMVTPWRAMSCASSSTLMSDVGITSAAPAVQVMRMLKTDGSNDSLYSCAVTSSGPRRITSLVASSNARTFRSLMTTALGTPVLPEVKSMYTGSLGATARGT